MHRTGLDDRTSAARDCRETFISRTEKVDLSIVIVNWNTRTLLLDCLRSLTSQLAPFTSQIIVVDNASDDDSVEAVRREFPLVSIMENKENLGFAKANNVGLRECEGRYILLINSDVVLCEGCLTSLQQYMEQRPEIGVLGPRILNADFTLQESCKQFPTIWNAFCRALALDTVFPNLRLFSSQLMRYWSHDDIRTVDILSGCFWMVRREAFKDVGPLDERFFMYAEDKDWCKRYWSAGWAIVYYPRAEAIHLAEGSSSRDPVRFYLEMCRANLRYWGKHYGKFQQCAIRMIMLLHDCLRIIGAGAVYLLRPSRRESAVFKLRRSLAVATWLILEHGRR
jgi:GT2 family glycosyltransferase